MPVGSLMRSRDRGRDADLFEVIYGDNPENVFRYTNSERPVTIFRMPNAGGFSLVQQYEDIQTTIPLPANSQVKTALVSGDDWRFAPDYGYWRLMYVNYLAAAWDNYVTAKNYIGDNYRTGSNATNNPGSMNAFFDLDVSGFQAGSLVTYSDLVTVMGTLGTYLNAYPWNNRVEVRTYTQAQLDDVDGDGLMVDEGTSEFAINNIQSNYLVGDNLARSHSFTLSADVVMVRIRVGVNGHFEFSTDFAYTAYTDMTLTVLEYDVPVEPMTFEPQPIKHDGLTNKGRDAGTPIKVTMPSDLPAARLFQGTPPRRLIFCRLWMGDVSNDRTPNFWGIESTFNLVFSGNVIESSRKGAETTLSCDTLGAGMKRPGLGRFYQRECTHVLYGERCRANRDAAERVTVADVVEGRSITLAAGWNAGSTVSDFRGGIFQWTSDRGTESASIVNTSGDTLTLDSIPYGLEVADAVSVFLGCPRTFEACTNLHNNPVNFGGQFGIPSEGGDPFFDNIYI